jgi:hypothetical protein
MSALQRQTFANQFQPLYLKDSGEDDNLTLETLTINAGGSILLNKTPGGTEGTQSGFVQANLPGQTGPNQYLALVSTNNPGIGTATDVLQCSNLYMNGGAVLSTPTYLSFDGTSDYGLSYGTVGSRTIYLDSLSSGKAIMTSNCVGPAPVAMDVGAPFAVAPVPTSPSAFGTFLTSPLYPTTTGQEYDICVKGTIALASGTPDATIPDQFVVSVSVGGTGKGTQTYSFNPNYLTFYVRDRLISSSSAPSVVVGVQNTQAGTSTAVYNATLTMADVVRVK